MKKARLACISCPAGDKEALEVKKGRFKGFIMSTTSVNVRQPKAYGYIDDWDECIKLTSILAQYRLDRFETYELLRFAHRLYEQGKITSDDLGLDGIDFTYENMAEWFRKIAYREGFGSTLADGFGDILQKYGEGTGRASVRG